MQRSSQTHKYAPNEQLRDERLKRGWSRVYIAEQIGVADPKTIGRWERGSAFPSAHFLQKLCELFEMPAAKLGLWQCKEHGESEALGELKRLSKALENIGGTLVPQEHDSGWTRTLPVQVSPRMVLLIIDDPWVFPEQINDVIRER